MSCAGWTARTWALLSQWPVSAGSSPLGKAGLSSACSNHADLLVTSSSGWISCGLVQTQVMVRVTKNPSFVASWVLEFDGWTSFSFDLSLYIAASVYRRIVEFVCTLINIPLKCCDVCGLLGFLATQAPIMLPGWKEVYYSLSSSSWLA